MNATDQKNRTIKNNTCYEFSNNNTRFYTKFMFIVLKKPQNMYAAPFRKFSYIAIFYLATKA